MELINILIRTSNRPALFRRCLKSVLSQNYKNLRIIVSYDRPVDYIPDDIESIAVIPDRTAPVFYDLYCNDLKACVTDGWFMFLDDDDILVPSVLHKIKFDAPAILHQLDHIGNLVPKDERLLFGQVGMPCLMLHHSLKDLYDFTGCETGDYYWVKAISDKVGVRFVPLIVVRSDRKGNGV